MWTKTIVDHHLEHPHIHFILLMTAQISKSLYIAKFLYLSDNQTALEDNGPIPIALLMLLHIRLEQIIVDFLTDPYKKRDNYTGNVKTYFDQHDNPKEHLLFARHQSRIALAGTVTGMAYFMYSLHSIISPAADETTQMLTANIHYVFLALLLAAVGFAGYQHYQNTQLIEQANNHATSPA